MAAAVAPLAALLAQLDARISSLEQKAGVTPAAPVASAASASPAAPASEELSKLAEEFDGLVQKYGQSFKDVCDKIGGDAVVIGGAIYKLWILSRSVIDMAGKSTKWDDAVSYYDLFYFAEILGPLPHFLRSADKEEGDRNLPRSSQGAEGTRQARCSAG